jgi:ATP-dependent helicase/nuclease subunit A
MSAWVRYKLDAGIDHVLLDEAQDTSPAQWAVLRPLADELFEASGNRRRTLFVVGDPKQSIYSFQGARPESFDDQRRFYAAKAKNAGMLVHEVAFNASFRTGPTVLAGVDAVFEQEHVRTGLTRDNRGTVHESLRKTAPGRIDVWPSIQKQKADEPEDWISPAETGTAPEVELAGRIARTITDWCRSGFAKPGEILVLVRKRSGFVNALSRALKQSGIAVAGADRLNLADHIAVQDLLAIARIAQQPADDLSLAALMKSPLFDLNDDHLLSVAPKRAKGESLLDALAASGDAALSQVAATVHLWRNRADTVPVYEFYASILGAGGARRAFVQRFGEEVDDVLDEFLRATEDSERAGTRGLDAFVERMTATPPELKREMDQGRDEVRIMTVHAAKGLEAEHVLLVDGGSDPAPSQQRPVMMVTPGATAPLDPAQALLWVDGAAKCPMLAAALAHHRQLAEDEYRRLLYVAMTRAKDTLTICLHTGTKGDVPDRWAEWLRSGLEATPQCRTLTHALGFAFQRYELLPTEDDGPSSPNHRASTVPIPLVPFAFPPLPPEPQTPRPLTPSAAGLAIEPEDDEAAPPDDLGSATPFTSPVLGQNRDKAPVRPDARRRGQMLHRLLQRLPDVAPVDRERVGARFLTRLAAESGLEPFKAGGRAASWHDEIWHDEIWHDEILAEALRILALPQCAHLFTEASRSEVAVSGHVRLNGEVRSVNGVIDRLIETARTVTLVDYKAGRKARSGPVASHVVQLALYRALVKQAFPGKSVEAVIIHTSGPSVLLLDPTEMELALRQLGIETDGDW